MYAWYVYTFKTHVSRLINYFYTTQLADINKLNKASCNIVCILYDEFFDISNWKKLIGIRIIQIEQF